MSCLRPSSRDELRSADAGRLPREHTAGPTFSLFGCASIAILPQHCCVFARKPHSCAPGHIRLQGPSLTPNFTCCNPQLRCCAGRDEAEHCAKRGAVRRAQSTVGVRAHAARAAPSGAAAGARSYQSAATGFRPNVVRLQLAPQGMHVLDQHAWQCLAWTSPARIFHSFSEHLDIGVVRSPTMCLTGVPLVECLSMLGGTVCSATHLSLLVTRCYSRCQAPWQLSTRWSRL